MTCKPITFPDGSPIVNSDTLKSLPFEKSSDSEKDGESKLGLALWYILAVLLGILLTVIVIYAICQITGAPFPFSFGKSKS